MTSTVADDHSLSFSFSSNIASTSSPPIPLASTWAAKYTATPSHPLINLAQGVPGSPPNDEFLERLGKSASDGSTTSYGDLRGDFGLRKELARDMNEVYGTRDDGKAIGVNEVVLTAGCNLAFYSCMVALAVAGDEIILPSPWYFNHEMTLTQLGIKAIPLICSSPTFLPSPTLCRNLITSKTRAIVLVSPSNPTGAIFPSEILEEFAAIAREYKIALIIDETYREFLYGRPHELFVGKNEWRSYLIHLFSFSKSYAIPGYRLGAIIASPIFQSQIHKTLDCLQICPGRSAQQVVEWAVEGTRSWREGVRDEIKLRGVIFRELMKDVEGWEVETVGGYFAYIKHPFQGFSSEKVASILAEHVGIVVLPGTFFGPPFANVEDDRYLRFSIANVKAEMLKSVPERLERLNKEWLSLTGGK